MYEARVEYVGDSPEQFLATAQGALSLTRIDGHLFVKDNKHGIIYRATDSEYVDLEKIYGAGNIRAVCIECCEPVFVRNVPGAQGMGVRNARSDARGDNQYPRGFAHYEENNGVDCSLYTGGDERLNQFRQNNEFDYFERHLNFAVLHDPERRREINAVRDFYMKILTAPKSTPADEAALAATLAPDAWRLSPAHREASDKAMLRIASMTGAAEQAWIFGLAGVVLINPCQKLSTNGRVMNVKFDLQGDTQDYPITRCFDGGNRILWVKNQIVMCWRGLDGRTPAALRRGGEQDVAFPSMAEFSERIIAGMLHKPADEVLITAIEREQRKRAGLQPLKARLRLPEPRQT